MHVLRGSANLPQLELPASQVADSARLLLPWQLLLSVLDAGPPSLSATPRKAHSQYTAHETPSSLAGRLEKLKGNYKAISQEADPSSIRWCSANPTSVFELLY